MTKVCEARVWGTEYVCSRCSLIWDINDPEPPVCELEEDEEPSVEKIRTKRKTYE